MMELHGKMMNYNNTLEDKLWYEMIEPLYRLKRIRDEGTLRTDTIKAKQTIIIDSVYNEVYKDSKRLFKDIS